METLATKQNIVVLKKGRIIKWQNWKGMNRYDETILLKTILYKKKERYRTYNGNTQECWLTFLLSILFPQLYREGGRVCIILRLRLVFWSHVLQGKLWMQETKLSQIPLITKKQWVLNLSCIFFIYLVYESSKICKFSENRYNTAHNKYTPELPAFLSNKTLSEFPV